MDEVKEFQVIKRLAKKDGYLDNPTLIFTAQILIIVKEYARQLDIYNASTKEIWEFVKNKSFS